MGDNMVKSIYQEHIMGACCVNSGPTCLRLVLIVNEHTKADASAPSFLGLRQNFFINTRTGGGQILPPTVFRE